jgi:hypothetical protein
VKRIARGKKGANILFRGGQAGLWAAGNHLLYVESTAYAERARRFFLRDIEMITCSDSNMRFNLGLQLASAGGLVTLAAGLVAGFINSFVEANPLIAIGIPVAIPLLLTIVKLIQNQVAGPSCEVIFHTAVQRQVIHALNRKRVAQRVLPNLIAQIRAAQPLDAPLQVALADLAPDATLHASKGLAQATMTHGRAERVPFKKWLTVVCFAGLVVLGISYLGDLFVYSATKNLLDTVLSVALVGGLLAAAINQSRSGSPSSMRIATVAGMLAVGISMFTVSIVTEFDRMNDPWYLSYAEPPTGLPHGNARLVFCALFAFVYITISAVGLLSLRDVKRSTRYAEEAAGPAPEGAAAAQATPSNEEGPADAPMNAPKESDEDLR